MEEENLETGTECVFVCHRCLTSNIYGECVTSDVTCKTSVQYIAYYNTDLKSFLVIFNNILYRGKTKVDSVLQILKSNDNKRPSVLGANFRCWFYLQWGSLHLDSSMGLSPSELSPMGLTQCWGFLSCWVLSNVAPFCVRLTPVWDSILCGVPSLAGLLQYVASYFAVLVLGSLQRLGPESSLVKLERKDAKVTYRKMSNIWTSHSLNLI